MPIPKVSKQAATETKSAFNGVKVFSATMFAQRDLLGDNVEKWIAANPNVEVVDIVVTQSSDSAFHCIAISVFYWEPLRAS